MITNFKLFEKLNIGYRFYEGVEGVFIREYKDMKDNFLYWIDFFKKRDIKYYIFHGSDSKGDFFYIFFPSFKKDKFPDAFDENTPYLPTIDEKGFVFISFYKDNIDNCQEIKADNLEDLEIEIKAIKYNL